MPPFAKELGRMLLIGGGILLGIGLLLVFGNRIPYLGDLPGDFHFEKGQFKFYFPLGTALIVSIGLTILLNLIFWLINK
ncbi:MAG: DUF2905 domain-containing protein [Candidatus Bipolaricaulota bacterium]